MQKLIEAVAGIALAVAVSSSAALAEQTKTIDRDISAQSVREVYLIGHNGNVRIKGGESKTIRLHAVVSVNDGASLADAGVDVTSAGGRVTLRDRCPRKTKVFLKSTSCGVDYTLEVPKSLRTNVQDSNGDVTVANVAGAIVAKSSNGNVLASDAGSTLELTTKRGNVDAVLATGWRGQSVSLESSIGAISLHVPAAFKGQLDAKTMLGNVRNDTKMTSATSGPAVRLRSSVGGITISYR